MNRIKCKDGFSVSVQASRYHYCAPRVDDRVIYEKYELGFPSEPDSLIEPYAENRDALTKTVYGYVPIEVVLNLIEKHGGEA